MRVSPRSVSLQNIRGVNRKHLKLADAIGKSMTPDVVPDFHHCAGYANNIYFIFEQKYDV